MTRLLFAPWGLALASGYALVSAMLGCTPPPPKVDYDTGKACTSSAGHGEPLVVDWQPGQRVDLEAAMKDGVALVHYDCKTIRLVRGCHIEGGYGFMATTTKEEVVRLVNADEVRANLPLSGSKLGAELEADFQRGATLDIALVMIGKKATTWRSIKSTDLQGENCGDVTHFIASASLGAFVMQTGENTSTKTAMELFNAGGSVSSKKFKHIRNTDGLIDECKKASPDANVPPQQCGAPLRLELVPLVDRVAKPDKPKGDGKGLQAASDEAQAPSCPEGFALSGGKCVRATKGAVFACKGDDAKECEAQCNKNEPNSCYKLAMAHRFGYLGVRQDLVTARTLYKKACEGGAAEACVDFGITLEHGLGGPKDIDGAYAIYKKACDNGEPTGCTALGVLFDNGIGVEENFAKAMRLFEKGCNGGHSNGCTFLGLMHMKGQGTTKDESKAMHLFERGCRGNHGQACHLLADYYNEGKGGVERDELQAFKLYVRGCDQDFGASCTELADRYLSGRGIPPEGRQGNPTQSALHLYEKACTAAQSDPHGCNKLGLIFDEGKIVNRDFSIANKLFQMGCENGSGLACKNLGINISLGQGAKTDKKTGFSLVQRGCELGVGSSCTLLGHWTYLGDGVPSDHKLAASFWEKGCNLKDTKGCLALGYAFQNGDGVPKKPTVAAELYARSCDDDEVDGCVGLGVLYYFGNGVDRNYAKAYKLFQFGCSKGDKEACSNSAVMQLHGEGTSKSEEKAVEIFRDLCENQHYMNACSMLGYLAKYGKGFAKDPARATSYSERACSGGHLLGCVNLASWIDENPTAKKEEIDRAFSLLQRACDGNERSGCAYLGYMYERGRGTAKDQNLAINLYRRSCDAGYPMACSSLEFVQELGTGGIPASPLVATMQYESQCKKKDNKDGRACAQAAFQYLLGRGVKRDRNKAVSLFRQACTLGDGRSCEQLKSMIEPMD